MGVARQHEEMFDEAYGPSIEELEAYEFAARAFRDHARYGLPRRGGSWDQPVIWRLALDCVHDALRHAELETQALSEL